MSSSPQRPTLTDIARSRTAGVIDPIVTVLARFNVSPDALTVLGMVLHFLFAWLIATGELRWAALAIFLGVPLDSLDGALARKIGRQGGNFGAFLDSTADRIAELILFGGFLYYFQQRAEVALVFAAYAAIGGSLMVSYTRSRAEGIGVPCKVGLFTRVERYILIVAALILRQPAIGIIILALGSWFTVGQRAYHVWKQTRLPDRQP